MPDNSSPFSFIAGALCLDFVNTVGSHTSENPTEKLSTFADLVHWSKKAGLIGEGKALELLAYAEVNAKKVSNILEEARAFREALFRIFGTLPRNKVPHASDVTALNEALRRFPIRLEVRPQGKDFCCAREIAQANDTWLLAPIAWSAADLLASDQMRRVRQCASATCGWLFIDNTKNHSRRWCAMNDCGSQAKARRYYQRKKKSINERKEKSSSFEARKVR
jgi:predicted RNA-binding Zn ribbon-like protein